MGKSLRSNRIQKNKSTLRTRVFGPVEEARTQRLSQRLAEIAAAAVPPPEPKKSRRAAGEEGDKDAEMDVEEPLRGDRDDDDAARSKDDEPVQGTSPGAGPRTAVLRPAGLYPAALPSTRHSFRRSLRLLRAQRRQRGPRAGSGDVQLCWSGDSFTAVGGAHVVDDEEDAAFFGAPSAVEQDLSLFALPFHDEAWMDAWRARASPPPPPSVSPPASPPARSSAPSPSSQRVSCKANQGSCCSDGRRRRCPSVGEEEEEAVDKQGEESGTEDQAPQGEEHGCVSGEEAGS